MKDLNVNSRDLSCCIGIETFIMALLNMRIGAPVVSANTGQFLQGMINRAAMANYHIPTVVDLPNIFCTTPVNIPDGAGFRLLLINVDKVRNNSFR